MSYSIASSKGANLTRRVTAGSVAISFFCSLFGPGAAMAQPTATFDGQGEPPAQSSAPAAAAPAPAQAPAAPAPEPVPSPASSVATPAKPAAEHIVRTKDGGMLRGDLIEDVPGSHVLIRIATGEVRRVEYPAIASIEPVRASPSTAGPSAPLPAPAAPAPERPAVEGTPVDVSFQPSDSRAKLDQYVPNVGYVTVCDGACNVTLGSRGTYRVSGRGVWDSNDFRLPPGQSNVTMRANVVGSGRRAGGWVMFGLGAGCTVVIGLPLMLAGAALRSGDATVDDPLFNDRETGRRVLIAGGFFTGLGLAGVIGGLVLATGGGTSVDFDEQGTPHVSLPGRLELTPAGLRF